MLERREAYVPPPFVGRTEELAQLWHGVESAAAGRGSLHLLVGEPGIGKTRLADELAERSAGRQVAVLWGRCWESGGAPAYWPWVQILRACASRLDELTIGERLRAAPELLHLLPEQRAVVPEVPELRPNEAELDRFRLFDCVTSFLRAAAAEHPLLLLLDDLHAADPSSLLMLRFLARELRSLPLAVVGTYREVEAARDPEISRILGDVAREGECIRLGGLSAECVARYIAAVAPQGAAKTTVDVVYATSEGNPLFLNEMMRLWISERPARGRAGTEFRPAIPDEIRAVIRRRLDPLPEHARRILAIAAVQGRDFDAALVDRCCESTLESVSEALSMARAAGVLRPIGDATGRFSFAHVLIRDVLYDHLSSTEQTALHRALATAMEQMHAADLAPHLSEIAHHHTRAALDGNVDKAIEFERRAGDRAAGMLAHDAAVRHYQHALRAVQLRQGGPRSNDRALGCELLLSLGDALWGAGDLARMRETYQRAAEALRDLAPEESAPRLARAALGMGGRQQRSHAFFDAEVVDLLEEARTALGDADSPLKARVLARLAYALYTQPGSARRRESLCREAETMARRVGDAGTLRWVLNDTRWALWGPDTIEERLRIAEELTLLAQRFGDAEMALGERIWRMVDFLEVGDINAFDAELEVYARFAREHPRPWFRWYIGRFEAMRCLLQGRFADAERHADEAFAAIKRTSHEDAFLIYGTQVAAIRAEQGRLAELEEALQSIAARYPAMPVWRYVLAYMHAELERPDAVRAEVERVATDTATMLPDGYLRIAAGAYLAEACAYLGDAERAGPLYSALRPYANRTVVLGFGYVCRGSVARSLGLLATTLGRHDAAAAHFEAALTAELRLGARPFRARTQLGYAQLLLGSPDRATGRQRAAVLLREAHATAVELGMQCLTPRVAALAESAGISIVVEAPPIEPRAHAGDASGPVCHLRREGDYWAVGLQERIVRVRHVRGLNYIAHLLRRPGEEVHVFDLIDLAEGAASEHGHVRSRDIGDAGEMIDAESRAAYKARLRELHEEIMEAEEAKDLGRIDRVRTEIDQLTEQLSVAFGLGGRSRRAASQANRARMAVAKAIRVALARIREHSTELADHLELVIKTGILCSYAPDPLRPVEWDLG